MRREQIDSFSAVPSILHTILARGDVGPERGPRLRSIRMGAGQVTEQLLDGLETAFPGVRIFITYGLTEIGLVTVLSPADLRSRAGSCGRLLPEVTVQLHDAGRDGIGEILVAGLHAARGYEGDEDHTRAVFRTDGIHTGDRGVIDPDGFLYLKGRSKDLIKSAGENIYPAEIETYLLSCPGVADCAVLGVADEQLGEVIRAYVAPAPGHALDAAAVVQFCRRSLSPLKRPRDVILCSALPRTANGKVDKQALLQLTPR
jgi:acyl-CoA synthetase (AMP-forming)/AMP-acid ligase II